MDRVIYLKLGNGNLHLPKLIGSFVMIAALLMIVSAGARMIESWDNVKYLNTCLKNASNLAGNPTAFVTFESCQQQAYYAGSFVRPDQENLTVKQAWMLVAEPIGGLFWWFAAFLVGVLLYMTGRLVLPVRERILEITAKAVGKFKKRR